LKFLLNDQLAHIFTFFIGFSVIYMMKDGGKGSRNVKALTVRISVCVVLFIVILIGMGTGKIIPSNSIKPPVQQQTTE